MSGKVSEREAEAFASEETAARRPSHPPERNIKHAQAQATRNTRPAQMHGLRAAHPRRQRDRAAEAHVLAAHDLAQRDEQRADDAVEAGELCVAVVGGVSLSVRWRVGDDVGEG